MKRKQLLLLLALLIVAATGAWAQSTYIVNQDNINTIFGGDGYTLGNAVKADDCLDFQGTIDINHSLVINKPVNIISTTQDAVVKLHTPAGDRTGNNPGSTFVINADGAGTQVQDIRLENTGMWIFNTSNVTFTGVTFHVDNASLCLGVGHVALRYSDHITFDGCTVYTKNNGGSSACVLTGSHDCTFKDTHFENAGNVGNILYIGNPYNTADMPSGFTMVSDDCKVINCTITADQSSALTQFRIQGGLRYLVEGCTVVNVPPSFSTSATAAADGYIIRNNTFTQGMSVPAFSTAEGNTVSGGTFTVNKGATVTNNNVIGNVSISANNATVSGTTVYLGSTITGNSILGKVTFYGNSKNNTFTGNTVISSEAYAVVMATTKDANNTVQNNVLIAKGNAGDAAIDPKTSTGNTISNNLSEAKAGDATWSFDAATGTLTIGGTGAMADFEQTTGGQSTAPWAFLSDKITRIVIGDGVTKVGNNAFADCKAVNDVFVKGAGTLTIGTAAFDATKTPAIYVPVGTEATYQTAWSAYAGSISGYMNCGDNASAVYDATTHTLTICGTGAMTDFASAADQPWKALQGEVKNVIIEPTITAIGANAFAYCSALTAVNIEGTGTTIPDGAFDGNATGRKIFVPAQAIAGYGESTYLADIYATGQCGAEGSDVIWELNAKTMALSISGTGAMADYSNSSMPWYSVRGKITSATIAEGVTTIGNYAFYNCGSMATVSIPAGVTSIGNYAFYNCGSMATVSIPAGVTSIGKYAFSNSALTAITIPAGLTTISDCAFLGCSKLETVNILDGLTSIGSNLFDGCSKLESITIPATVTTISGYAFRDCRALTAITIPAGVTTIGNYAFYNCSMATVSIPASVTSVGRYAFSNCTMLAEVNIFAPSLQTYGGSAFQNTHADLKIYVPAASVDTYKAGWSDYADKIVALPYYALTMKDGTEDADKWSVKVGDAEKTVTLPINNLKGGETVTVTYTGTKRVKSVKAVKKAQ